MLEEKKKAHSNSSLNPELQKAQKDFDKFEENVKEMTMDRMNKAPKEDVEPQTKLSQKEIEKNNQKYLKPVRTISIAPKERFNEDYRKEYEFAKEYVNFVAEHRELIGCNIEKWTKPFAGVPAEYWEVPTNVPVWGPRYLAEEIKKCSYHRLKMEESTLNSSDSRGAYYGTMAVDSVVQRLDAHPVSSKKSIFMGANNF